MNPAASDVSAEGLTSQQLLAAASSSQNVYIEAGPGTGKTTVSAQRFGVLRFAPAYRGDARAVVAVSFTRAATRTLVKRVTRFWGSTAQRWPHRVVTIDTLVLDLVHSLLRAGMLAWPNGHTTLQVHDSWASLGPRVWTKVPHALGIDGAQVSVTGRRLRTSTATFPAKFTVPYLQNGVCTHEDVRAVLEHALRSPVMRDFVKQRLQTTVRALIVDEVFDANDLDIAVIEAAHDAGVAVTLVGDPWQALYEFRGARPDNVPHMLGRTGIPKRDLTQSFRWLEPRQHELADKLRAGQPIVLDVESSTDSVDVALALHWKPLWDLGSDVLPLAFRKAFGGSTEEAVATLLLNHITRNVLGRDATYLGEALTALAITDHDVTRQLEPDFQTITQVLRVPGKDTLKTAYSLLEVAIKRFSPRSLRKVHASYTSRLDLIRTRLLHKGRPIPGMTTHRAKGGEWNVVGVYLTDTERTSLGNGLTTSSETHRKLYVACTRARRRTVELA